MTEQTHAEEEKKKSQQKKLSKNFKDRRKCAKKYKLCESETENVIQLECFLMYYDMTFSYIEFEN